MITNEEARKAIEKYQKEHPLQFGTMIDVTAMSSKEGADIISQTIERVSKKIEEDTELWCICEMAKMYMQGVKPVYPVRPKGEWEIDSDGLPVCKECGEIALQRVFVKMPHLIQEVRMVKSNFCPNCGAIMTGGDKE